jgi:hypothetical protein
LKIFFSIRRGGTKVYAYHLDFQYINFPYAFFIVKKLPLYVNFSIPSCGNWFFSQCSTLLVDMRFCGHVPNSTRNKYMKFLSPYLLQKMVFLASKTLLSHSGIGETKNLINFEHYDLASRKEWVRKIWWTCRHRSWLQDLTVRSTKRVTNFGHFTLLAIGVVLRLFWWKTPLEL